MSDARTLLQRISAFRLRLSETAQEFQADSESVDSYLKKLLPSAPTSHDLPRQISGRLHRNLLIVRELIQQQKVISSHAYFQRFTSSAPSSVQRLDGARPVTGSKLADPVVSFHQESVQATEAVLRLASTFPESIEVQNQMCVGLESLIDMIRDRLALTQHLLEQRTRHEKRCDRLLKLFHDVLDQKLVAFSSFVEMAEDLINEARQGEPLYFSEKETDQVDRAVVEHSLASAAVVARLAPHDFEWASQVMPAVVASLLKDLGMVRVPKEIFFKADKLAGNEWHWITKHPVVTVEILQAVLPECQPLLAALRQHHERPDGTGYPQGLQGEQLQSLAKLLAVADRYAACRQHRAYRPAFDSRTALMEVLHEAETGHLDTDFAEYLLHLSFHPVGTVVELNDGRVAVVASNPTKRIDLRAASRPVVMILTTADKKVYSRPVLVDLAEAQLGGIYRSLSLQERQKYLAKHFPEYCW